MVAIFVIGGMIVSCFRKQCKLEVEQSQRKLDPTPLGAPEWGPGARGPDGGFSFKIRIHSLSNPGALAGPELMLGGRGLQPRAPQADAGLQSQEGWLIANGAFGVSSARSGERLVLLQPVGGEGGQGGPWCWGRALSHLTSLCCQARSFCSGLPVS